MKAPHQLDTEQLFGILESTARGLSSGEAGKRLDQYGPNRLRETRKKTAWGLFLGQFKDLMILILLVAAILSGVMGDLAETIIILVIVLLNAAIGFMQEYRAEKAMEALKNMSRTQARVLRDGSVKVLDAEELVPGDLVLLEAGNMVPADLRLIEVHGLKVDESSLTGESVPVEKHNRPLAENLVSPVEKTNMCFKGSLVDHGRALGLVCATGMQTELGRIAELLQQEESGTPLQLRMKHFSRNTSFIILFICLILLAVGLLRGEAPMAIVLLSISLAVAAIPETLPALITVALSRGAARLAGNKTLIRKLSAVESLGSVSYICSDKTGTLTQNRMTVIRKHEIPEKSPEETLSLFELAVLLNHDVGLEAGQNLQGDATETAMLRQVMEARNLNAALVHQLQARFPRVAELPFDSGRKCMSTLHRAEGRYLLLVKGASERILSLLAEQSAHGELQALSLSWSSEGLRVLAFAYRWLQVLPEQIDSTKLEKDLQFCGFMAMVDPPRESTKASIATCKSAGIRPVMITGDHPATAAFIAKELGILEAGGRVMSGTDLLGISQDVFLDEVEHIRVYARVSPEQKLRIVKTLQSKGHFVAMTGDGVNDAPSLKAANIGVAMGISGTDVSKEAAHMILLDDNFSTIVSAVHEGRRIYDNIRKFVKYIMTCNSAEIWTLFLAPLLGMPMPLLPIHILWINLVTDGLPALALVNEKAEPDLMQRPPRPASESLFAGGMGTYILLVGLLMAGLCLGTQAWALEQGLEHWQTMVFTVLAMLQLGQVMGIRSERNLLYRQGVFSNMTLIWSVLITALLQLGVIYLPVMNRLFNTHPLSAAELSYCAAIVLVFFHVLELEKWLRWKLNGKGS